MDSLYEPDSTRNGQTEGEARRDAALGLLRIRRANLIRKFTAAAIRVALAGGDVCADDIRDLVPIPPDISPKCVGAVFHSLALAGILRRVEYRKSLRPVAHARPISIWQLADRDAATAHLAELEKIIAATAD